MKLRGDKDISFVRPSPGDIRIMLCYLANELRKKENTTVLFLAESGQGKLYLPEEVLKYISDAKIELKKSTFGTEAPRTIITNYNNTQNEAHKTRIR